MPAVVTPVRPLVSMDAAAMSDTVCQVSAKAVDVCMPRHRYMPVCASTQGRLSTGGVHMYQVCQVATKWSKGGMKVAEGLKALVSES